MPLDVRIISGGTTYYLVNSSGTPTRGGAPTGASTTPFSLQTASWTQSAAERQTVYSGAPPFRVGSSPLYAGYGNVTETLNIGVMASSADNLADLLRTLRRVLNTALFSTPAVLYWQPQGASQPVYFEIYSADVQETGEWNNPSAGFTDVLLRVTWTRSAVGGRLSVGETLLNAVNFGYNGTSVPTSVVSLGASGAGDLVNDGQPMNVQAVTNGGFIDAVLRAGVVESYTYLAGTASTSTTSTATLIAYTTTLDPRTIKAGTKGRVTASIGSPSGDAVARAIVAVQFTDATRAVSIYTSPWISLRGANGTADFGGFDLGALKPFRNASSVLLRITFEVRSTTGASVFFSITFMELMRTYTWCEVTWPFYGTRQSGQILAIYGFPESSGVPALPLAVPAAWIQSAAGALAVPGVLRGTAPRYYPGSSLYLQWLTYNYIYNGNDSAAVTATQAPLYLTLRGNG